MTSSKENHGRTSNTYYKISKGERLVNDRLSYMEYVQKHCLTCLYLKSLKMKVIVIRGNLCVIEI